MNYIHSKIYVRPFSYNMKGHLLSLSLEILSPLRTRKQVPSGKDGESSIVHRSIQFDFVIIQVIFSKGEYIKHEK